MKVVLSALAEFAACGSVGSEIREGQGQFTRGRALLTQPKKRIYEIRVTSLVPQIIHKDLTNKRLIAEPLLAS